MDVVDNTEWNVVCVCGPVFAWKKAAVASVGVLLAETEGAVVALWDAASALVKKFNQTPPSPEIHPELVEEGPVDKVMLVGD